MRIVLHRVRALASVSLLCGGLLASGAFAADCGVVEVCPMMSMEAASHCATGSAVMENCCASMSAAPEPVELPISLLAPVDSSALSSSERGRGPRGAARPPALPAPRPSEALYTLHAALLI